MLKKLPLLILASICTLCSCTDDLLFADTEETANKELVSNDLTAGYNVLVFDQEDGDSCFIPLGKNGNVTFSNANPALAYEKVVVDGKPVLKVSIIGEAKTIMKDSVTVCDASNPDNKKSVDVYLRPEVTEVISRADDSSLENKKKKCCEFLGCVIHPLCKIENATAPIFKTATLKKLALDEDDGSVEYAWSNKETRTTIHSFDYTSHMKSIAKSAGLNLNIPIKALIISPSATWSNNETYQNAESRELVYYTDRVVKVYCKLGDDGGSYIPYLKNKYANMLNNSGSNAYNEFKDTLYYGEDPNIDERKGIFCLIDKLGGFQFSTGVIVGGESTAGMSRKKVVSTHDMTWGLNVGLQVSIAPMPTDADIAKWGQAGPAGKAMYQAMGAYVPSVGAHYNRTEQEKEETRQMDFKKYEVNHGGETTESGTWKLDDDKYSTWTALSFSNLDYFDKASSGEDEAQDSKTNVNYDIHSITELIKDKTSKRYQLVKEAITPDADGIIPYYKWKGYYQDAGATKLVIVDAMLREATPGVSYPIFERCEALNKTLAYYPVCTNFNSLGLFDYTTKTLPLNWGWATQAKVKDDGNYGPVALFVAYDWIDATQPNTGVGIKDIWLGYGDEANLKELKYRRGCHSDLHIDGDSKDGGHFLYVQYASPASGEYKGTPADSLITGVGVYLTYWDNDNGAKKGHVLASSCGTDMVSAYDYAYFNSYWDPDRNSTAGKTWVKEEDRRQSPDRIINIKRKADPHTALIAFTRKPITRELYEQKLVNGKKVTCRNFKIPQAW